MKCRRVCQRERPREIQTHTLTVAYLKRNKYLHASLLLFAEGGLRVGSDVGKSQFHT